MPHTPPLLVVANDDRMYLEIIMDRLREAGYQVLITDTGPNAHQLIQTKKADMAILDMSVIDPDRMLRTVTMLRLDVATKHLPVLVCCANTSFVRRNTAHLLAMGCRILPTPFDLEMLLEEIQQVLPLTALCK